MALIEDTEESMLRSDLWPTMTVAELVKQQELMVTKMSALLYLMSASPSPAVEAMYSAMQMGFNDLNNILNTRTSQEK